MVADKDVRAGHDVSHDEASHKRTAHLAHASDPGGPARTMRSLWPDRPPALPFSAHMAVPLRRSGASSHAPAAGAHWGSHQIRKKEAITRESKIAVTVRRIVRSFAREVTSKGHVRIE